MKSILSILCLLLAGCASLQDGPGPGVLTIPGPRMIEVGDRLVIELRTPEPSDVVEDVVDRQGQIVLPLLGEIAVVAMTPDQARERIRGLYMEQGHYWVIDVIVEVIGKGPLPTRRPAQQEAREPRPFHPEPVRGPSFRPYQTQEEIEEWEHRAGERFPSAPR